MKDETFFLLSQTLSDVAGPNPLMFLLPSSSNVGKQKTKTIHVNKKSGKKKTKTGFHNQRNVSVLIQHKAAEEK